MICDKYDDQGQHVCSMLLILTYKELAHIFEEVHFLNWGLSYSQPPPAESQYTPLCKAAGLSEKKPPQNLMILLSYQNVIKLKESASPHA